MNSDSQITGLTSGTPATFADYEALMRDRPRKFSAEEVGFVHVTPMRSQNRCGNCIHWYIGAASGKAVCEIMRLPNEASVSNLGVCRFWNRNGTDYPLLQVL